MTNAQRYASIFAMTDHEREDFYAAQARSEAARQAEREARRVLALRLITLGYKGLARELHPDKGGSPERMTRLNAVRTDLRRLLGRAT